MIIELRMIAILAFCLAVSARAAIPVAPTSDAPPVSITPPVSIAAPAISRADKLVLDGNAMYYRGEHSLALEAYQKAAKLSTSTLQPWINGGTVLEETGEYQRAADWY